MRWHPRRIRVDDVSEPQVAAASVASWSGVRAHPGLRGRRRGGGERRPGPELTRGPSAAELDGPPSARWPGAGRSGRPDGSFPQTVGYAAEQGGEEKARRGWASRRRPAATGPWTPSCAKALRQAGCRGDPACHLPRRAAGRRRHHRRRRLRPTRSGAARAKARLPRAGRPAPGLRTLAFPGTVTDRFTSAGRQTGPVRQAGPYVVMTTVGQVDGRPARAVGEQRPDHVRVHRRHRRADPRRTSPRPCDARLRLRRSGGAEAGAVSS